MALSASAKDYLSRFSPGPPSPLWETDPEFMELFANFALDEVVNQGDLDDAARMMAILAALLGCQGVEEYRVLLPAALRAGVTPVQVKEILYQSVPYLGIGRVRPFFSVTNQVLTEQGVALPLEPGSTTTAETRLAAGNQAQVDIFGEGMRGFQNSGPEESRHINRWLADNCFGDYYTRGGLDYKQREMITFCFLAALGGCEPQLTSHAGANLRIGNDNAFLIQVISQCLPYIGYPRSLNALRCVNDAAPPAERSTAMTIAEVSRKYDISADTLRYYERIGLIPPVPRTRGGLRDYGEESCGWIQLMKCMRAAGVQIEALIEYVDLFQQGDATLDARKALLVEQRDQLVSRMAEMQASLDPLNQKIDRYEQGMMTAEQQLRRLHAEREGA